MEHDGMFYNRQPQTCASALAAATLVDTQKTVKQPRQILVVDTPAGVVQMNVVVPLVFRLVTIHAYRYTVASMYDGVLYQVAENRVDKHAVAR